MADDVERSEYEEERDLARELLEEAGPGADGPELIALAQVHATLAVAAALTIGPEGSVTFNAAPSVVRGLIEERYGSAGQPGGKA